MTDPGWATVRAREVVADFVDHAAPRLNGAELAILTLRVAAALQQVRVEACRACQDLVLRGTDGCSTCEPGRISVYTQGTRCLECRRGDAGRN